MSHLDLTDEDMKRGAAAMLRAGKPLVLHPRLADDAVLRGFVEGVHFIRSVTVPEKSR